MSSGILKQQAVQAGARLASDLDVANVGGHQVCGAHPRGQRRQWPKNSCLEAPSKLAARLNEKIRLIKT